MSGVTIGKGSLAGKGVYAKRGFKEGEIVIKYDLKPLTEGELSDLPEAEKEFIHVHWGRVYLYTGPERYVNHSRDPNTLQDLVDRSDVALRDIIKGEMITTNSAKDDTL